jgi:hypothetical protein
MGYGRAGHWAYDWSPKYQIASNAVTVATNIDFSIDFNVYDNPDRPFVLSIEGLSSDGTNVPVPRIAYKPATISRPEMIMPY